MLQGISSHSLASKREKDSLHNSRSELLTGFSALVAPDEFLDT